MADLKWKPIVLSDCEIENSFTVEQQASKPALRVYSEKSATFIEYTLDDLRKVLESVGYDMVKCNDKVEIE